ncbi:hypothetical protein LSTR_LSTR007546 [Laodelphax striatellus]|uniref:Uncharacterized protein n=1 Tax=Laodelphax striatellus TaxID=195883 RepID=A0A482XSD5_LAOST|nr:hypothetical protein LSTR_LSTR007546 [Laodelphax striatellus]
MARWSWLRLAEAITRLTTRRFVARHMSAFESPGDLQRRERKTLHPYGGSYDMGVTQQPPTMSQSQIKRRIFSGISRSGRCVQLSRKRSLSLFGLVEMDSWKERSREGGKKREKKNKKEKKKKKKKKRKKKKKKKKVRRRKRRRGRREFKD